MKAQVQVTGAEEVERTLAALAKKYSQAVADAALAGGQLVRTEAIASIQKQSAGKTVIREREGGETYEHTVSKPGDAPNSDSGHLVRNIHVDGDGKDIKVGTPLDYGRDLETGTARMAARPWLRPALEKRREQIKNLFRAAVKK